MSRRIIDLDGPERFIAVRDADAGGEDYYLQTGRGGRVVTVGIERQQVALLADRLLIVLGELERRGLLAIEARGASGEEPGGAGRGEPWAPEPIAPLHEEFRVGTLTIGWDNDASRVIIEAFALVFDAGARDSALPADADLDEEDVPDDDPLGPDLLRVRLTPLMALRFARLAGRLAG